MLHLPFEPIITGQTKKAQIAQDIFNQTESLNPAQRGRILTQIKRACDYALNEIPVEKRGDQDVFLSDLALEQVQDELKAVNRDSGKIILDGAPYTVNVKDSWDFNADNGKAKDEPKLIEHPRHQSVKNWHYWDNLQKSLQEESATCTRKKSDAVKDYKLNFPDAKPTSTEYTLSYGD